MNPILMYVTQFAVTILACFLLTAYLRPHLKRILVDLCRTESRAQFWTAFSNVLLIALPVVFGMGFHPGETSAQATFFTVARQLQANLIGFIFALVAIGAVVSFFALVAPRPAEKS
jgi:predicted Abi (CAAX) family protease